MAVLTSDPKTKENKTPRFHKKRILEDLYQCCLSRELSLLLRKEVLTGKAKFGAGNAGKELPFVAAGHVFQKGDFWAGYYRDQTVSFIKGVASPTDFFTTLYGDAGTDPHSGGRQMSNSYVMPLVDEKGAWRNLQEQYNVISCMSPVAGNLTHAIGLALASKAYRGNEILKENTQFSSNGNEVCFCTIGDAATSEGIFFEAVNAAGVMQIPIAFIVLDDGYGISVPTKYQTTKECISTVLEGFRANDKGEGLDIYAVKAWDYEALCDTFEKGIAKMRKTHTPAIFHMQECTQPQGHSTSGSHERYKSEERLAWELEVDCIRKFKQWIIRNKLAAKKEIETVHERARKSAIDARDEAWELFNGPNQARLKVVQSIFSEILAVTGRRERAQEISDELDAKVNPVLSHLLKSALHMQFALVGEEHAALERLNKWIADTEATGRERYDTELYSDTAQSALKVPVIPAQYAEDAQELNGSEILNAFFDQALTRYPNLFAFGEDLGKIGGVNQSFAGLQQKYGEERVFDTGIREWTIVGQAIGMSMRGLRPIAELQYLDYLSYAHAPLTDDLATIRYRTKGKQIAPALIRTRGHRLEGIWHSGSPMGMVIHSFRGIYILVPRNMTQAAGMYNTMLQSDDPAIVIECLNGYRLKEKLPSNIGEYTVALGVPEVIIEGTDVTLVTYGSCVRIAEEGIRLLNKNGISVELIDVQTLIPFDLEGRILESLKKTNRIVFLDEDVPGGASAYMLQEVLEKQGGYQYLDSAPVTLSGKDHRPAFTDDGDFFSKPAPEHVFKVIYQMMHEVDPALNKSLRII